MRSFRITRRTAVLAFVGTTVAVTTAAVNSWATPLCEKAQDWVSTNADALPTSLVELEKHPMMYRRAIYAASPGVVKKAFWEQQFQRYLEPSSPLTERQRAFVRTVMKDLDAYVVFKTADPDTFQEAAVAEFGRELAGLVFASLGAPEGSSGQLAHLASYSSAAAAVPSAGVQAVVAAITGTFGAARVACECEVGDNWCFWNHCQQSSCTWNGEEGCGWLNNGPCNGVCEN